ncbi:hypothetical protein Tco_0763182 [Tanacetum coccineum]
MLIENEVEFTQDITKNGMDQVIERGPWLIRNMPLILNKWAPNVSLKPSKDGLSLIGTKIGKPIMLDAFISSMCVDSWGRINFARALIEIHATLELKKEVRMAIPIDEDNGTGYTSEVSFVDPIIDTSANDGFTKVVSRKNNGKKIANQPKNQIAGLHLYKPKSTFYIPINKHANDKQSKKNTTGNEKASTSQASGDKSTPISHSFSVLNSDEGAVCEELVPTNDVGTSHIKGNTQNPESGMKNNGNKHMGIGSSKEDDDKIQEEESLWLRF